MHLELKVKFTLNTVMEAQREAEVQVYSFLYPGARWGLLSTKRPGRFTPGEQNRYALYRRLGGPQGRSGMVQNISPPTGIRSPARLACSESLCRLRYPGPHL